MDEVQQADAAMAGPGPAIGAHGGGGYRRSPAKRLRSVGAKKLVS